MNGLRSYFLFTIFIVGSHLSFLCQAGTIYAIAYGGNGYVDAHDSITGALISTSTHAFYSPTDLTYGSGSIFGYGYPGVIYGYDVVTGSQTYTSTNNVYGSGGITFGSDTLFYMQTNGLVVGQNVFSGDYAGTYSGFYLPSALVYGDGILFGISSSGNIIGYDITTQQLTSQITSNLYTSTDLAYRNGTIYGRRANGDLVGFDVTTGLQVSSTPISNLALAGDLIFVDDILYGISDVCCSSDRDLYGIDPLTGQLISTIDARIYSSGGLSYAPSSVPLPASLWLFGTGLLGIIGLARRRAP